MQRIVSVWFPLWPIERMRRARPALVPPPQGRDGARPFALVASGAHGLVLSAVNARARADGLHPGQTLADARAAIPALLTRPAEPERDRAALRALALWCGRYGPRRNCQGEDGRPEDGLWIDITGVAHLFGGEARLLDDLSRRCRSFGLTARIGLADTTGAAFALARYGYRGQTVLPKAGNRDGSDPIIAASGQTQAALAPLPAEALRLPADCTLLLKRLGLRRIGQLYGLPRQALAQRFRSPPGTTAAKRKKERDAIRLAGAVLARLDQALGTSAEPLVPLEEPPAHLVRRAFAEPLISADGVAAATAALAADLCALLDAGGRGGSRFALALYRADGTCAQARIGLSRPGRDPAHLVALLAHELDALDAGFGIDVMTLAATETAPLSAAQIALPVHGMRTPGAGIAPLIDRLSNRLGPARVLRLVPGDSHIPERAERRRPALSAHDETPRRHDTAPSPATTAARPPLLLPAPEPIAVTAEVPEGPPLRFAWRRLSRRVVRAEGPERIEPEWWRGIGRTPSRHDGVLQRPRDYYRIEDAGGARYWVFRAGLWGRDDDSGGPPIWFLHGVFG